MQHISIITAAKHTSQLIILARGNIEFFPSMIIVYVRCGHTIHVHTMQPHHEHIVCALCPHNVYILVQSLLFLVRFTNLSVLDVVQKHACIVAVLSLFQNPA